jgi:hypothetical protein
MKELKINTLYGNSSGILVRNKLGVILELYFSMRLIVNCAEHKNYINIVNHKLRIINFNFSI